MAEQTGLNLGLNYGWDLGEVGWNTGNDESLLLLDKLVMPAVEALLAAPPGTEVEGELYLVNSSPSGAWTGHARELAYYNGTGWDFYTCKVGYVFFIKGGTYINRLFSWQGGFTEPFARIIRLLSDSIIGVDASDATKKLALTLSGITTGTTRTWTAPNKDGTFMTSTGDTMSGDLNLADNQIIRPKFKDAAQTMVASAATGLATIDLSAGNVYSVTLDGSISGLAMSNPPGAGIYGEVLIIFTQGASAYTVSWDASVAWPGGAAPTITATNGKRDIIRLRTIDGGLIWLGEIVAQNI
jgi:hypothetical protein